MFRSAGLVACLDGSYSPSNASSCLSCPSHSASTSGAGSCTCSAGYSSTGSGTTLSCSSTRAVGATAGAHDLPLLTPARRTGAEFHRGSSLPNQHLQRQRRRVVHGVPDGQRRRCRRQHVHLLLGLRELWNRRVARLHRSGPRPRPGPRHALVLADCPVGARMSFTRGPSQAARLGRTPRTAGRVWVGLAARGRAPVHGHVPLMRRVCPHGLALAGGTACLPGSYSGNLASTCSACPGNSGSATNSSTCSCNAGYSGSGTGASLACAGTSDTRTGVCARI